MMDRKTGARNINGKPRIEGIDPGCALPGGEVRITGTGLRPAELRRPVVQFGDVDGSVIISSEQFIVGRVPEGAASGEVVVTTNGQKSNRGELRIALWAVGSHAYLARSRAPRHPRHNELLRANDDR